MNERAQSGKIWHYVRPTAQAIATGLKYETVGLLLSKAASLSRERCLCKKEGSSPCPRKRVPDPVSSFHRPLLQPSEDAKSEGQTNEERKIREIDGGCGDRDPKSSRERESRDIHIGPRIPVPARPLHLARSPTQLAAWQ